MALTNSWREIAIEKATKQPQMVNFLLNTNPVLANMPMEPTSNGTNHVYEEMLSITEAQVVDLDEALPTVDSTSALKQMNVSAIGGTLIVGEDKAKAFGGPGYYFNTKIPGILEKTGNSLEKSTLYNNMRAAAVAAYSNSSLTGNTDHAILAGGSGSLLNSIIAVKWESGNTTGLYNPEGFGKGMLFDIKAISNGALYAHTDSRLVYGARLKSHFGVLNANPRNVATIMNIDADNIPTEDEIDTMLEAVRADSMNTVIYMHPGTLRLLRAYKDSALRVGVEDKNFDRQIEKWNGIPVVTSYNFLKNGEAAVTL